MDHDRISPYGINVHTVYAFSHNGAGGNPAGVVLEADGLDEIAMAEIATKVGHSETAFVSKSATEGRRLDFFTPTMRIPHCGHATVAAFSLLKAKGDINDGRTSKETVDGPRAIYVESSRIFLQQLPPSYRPLHQNPNEIADALGISQSSLDPSLEPTIGSTGNPFLLVALRSSADLEGLKPNLDRILELSKELDVMGFYPFAVQDQGSDVHAYSRMLGPAIGIPEESATGMAAGPLGCILRTRYAIRDFEIRIEQGRFMSPSSPSRLHVRQVEKDGEIVEVLVGGEAFMA